MEHERNVVAAVVSTAKQLTAFAAANVNREYQAAKPRVPSTR
jgi:hypothetical protein